MCVCVYVCIYINNSKWIERKIDSHEVRDYSNIYLNINYYRTDHQWKIRSDSRNGNITNSIYIVFVLCLYYVCIMFVLCLYYVL